MLAKVAATRAMNNADKIRYLIFGSVFAAADAQEINISNEVLTAREGNAGGTAGYMVGRCSNSNEFIWYIEMSFSYRLSAFSQRDWLKLRPTEFGRGTLWTIGSFCTRAECRVGILCVTAGAAAFTMPAFAFARTLRAHAQTLSKNHKSAIPPVAGRRAADDRYVGSEDGGADGWPMKPISTATFRFARSCRSWPGR